MAKAPNKDKFDPASAMQSMFSFYDPEKMKQMFDPQNFGSQFQSLIPSNIADNNLLASSKAQFEAMMAANKEAAATYQDLLQKQMAIFEKMTKSAGDMVSGGDMMKLDAEGYSKALSEAFELMKELAETTRAANEKVFQDFQARVNDAMSKGK